MITKFNQYITESLKDKMVGKSLEDTFTYDNFKTILRKFTKELHQHKDLEILEEQIPILIDSNLEDLRFFVIKENIFTGDDKGNVIPVEPYISAVEYYIKDSLPELIEIPQLTSGLIEKVLVYKDKKVVIVHAAYGSMIVLNKNIFY